MGESESEWASESMAQNSTAHTEYAMKWKSDVERRLNVASRLVANTVVFFPNS